MTSATDYQQAMIDVRARVAASRTSFSAGMAILPKARREAMYALYAFCREVDDIADDGATPESRRHDLQQWRERITALFAHHKTPDSITRALLPAIEAFALVEDDFQAIIDGMEMDAGAAPLCGPTMSMLDLYCDRVASAVGRASVRIFGDQSLDAMRVAHHLGRALQLTNILRDIAEDAARGRLYLPEELLAKHKVQSREPNAVMHDQHLQDVCRELAITARNHFAEAEAAMRLCIPVAMRPAKSMCSYYHAVFLRLIKADWQDVSVRVSLPKWEKVWLGVRGMVG